MKTVTIMRGIPGAGKSRYADNVNTAHIISADRCPSYLINGVWTRNPSVLPAAHDWAYTRFLQSAADHIIVDNTNISAWEIAPYYRYAEVNGRKVTIVRIIADPIIAWRRNTHQVPLKIILDMHNRLQDEFLPRWWKEIVIPSEDLGLGPKI